MELSEKVLQLRKQAGLTQQQLADQAGLSLRTIQRIEKGSTKPYGHSLQVLAEALDHPLEAFTAMEETKAASPDQLRIMNLMTLFGFVFPYGQLIMGIWGYRRLRGIPSLAPAARRILNFQLFWLLISHVLMVLVGMLQGPLVRAGWVPSVPYVLYVFLACLTWHIVHTLITTRRLAMEPEAVPYPKIPQLF